MEERMLTCPQCSHQFALDKHAPGGLWECPSCSHEFRPATSDVSTGEEVAAVEEASQGCSCDRHSIISLVMLVIFALSTLASLTWAVPYAQWEASASTLNSMPCFAQSVFCLGDMVSQNFLAVWPITLMAVFFSWLFAIRFFKGIFRTLFYVGLVLFYLGLMGVISATVVMANGGCFTSCGGCPLS